MPVPILHRRLARRFRFAAARSAATASEPDGGDSDGFIRGRPELVRLSNWRQCVRGDGSICCISLAFRDFAVGDARCGGAGGGAASATGAVTAGTFGIADTAAATGDDACAAAPSVSEGDACPAGPRAEGKGSPCSPARVTSPEAAATLLRAAAAPTRLFLRPGGSDARVAWRKTGLGSLMALRRGTSEAKDVTLPRDCRS